ncbi:rhomboid family intramembrane serine protease [Paraglaciecola chathamensis]|uniref:Rhomboid family intramembrane serine protease n=1 Tax=Paraglaciecola chathamensis TaxID=368405 RepID=A0ABS0W860_9ALTE|nr:rhomboid family intramembrane serine protease [Paraglaciecola chathamensis]MBJ2134944.1 rhomboid family intramembrane serine protease [Paraglaciecola chathamensis]
MNSKNFTSRTSSGLSQQLKIVGCIFVLITAIEIINLLTGRALNHFGNIPRYIPGLIGVLTGPFLHGSLSHYLSNIIPLCVLSFLMLQYGNKRFFGVTFFCIILTGLLVWLFGRSASHIGASSVIYSYFGFLLLAGFLSRKFKLILISLLVAFFYGGLIFGVLPARTFVSWEGHLFGFISGLIAARLWAKNVP